MGNRSSWGVEHTREAVGWLTADRLRIFAVSTVAALIGTALCILVPHWFFSGVLSIILAFAAATLGFLTITTWWASREGLTDRSSVWDTAPDRGVGLADVLPGFQAIREEAPPPSRDDDGV